MIALYILLVLLAVLAVLLLICLLRARLLKPTAALTAEPPASDEARAEAYARTLSQMVQIETVSDRNDPDRSKFAAFQAALPPLFPHVFAACEISHPGDGLVVRYPGTGGTGRPAILLMSHHDVVPADGASWSHPPFSGDLDDGRIWGRGTVDTKGSLMCELQALDELIAGGWRPENDVYITSSCSEEYSGDSCPQIVDWLKERGVRIGMLMDEGGMILAAPISGVRGRYCMVGTVEKGYADVRFTASGRGGHASAPAPGSPLPRLGAFMAEIDRKNPFRVELSDTELEMFRRFAPNMAGPMKLIFANLWLFAPLVRRLMPKISHVAAAQMQTTCAFTMAQGAAAANVLPAEASVTANLRLIHHQPNEESFAVLDAIAQKYDLKREVLYQDPPRKPVDFHSWQFRFLESVAADIYPGYDVVPYIMTGSTDAKFFDEISDCSLRFAPIEIDAAQYESIHSRDENLYARALVPAVDFYKEILKGYPAQSQTAR